MQLTKRRVVLLGGVAGALTLMGFAFRPKPLKVETVKVTSGVLVTTVDEDARTRVPERYEISSPVSGHHLRIEVHPGDRVSRGDVLVRMHPAPLDARQREELRSKLLAADDVVRESSAALRRAQVQSAQAERERRRIENLAATGIASAHDRDQAQTTAANLAREAQAARSRLNAAQHNVDVVRASLDAGSSPAGVLTISSPADGRVLTVHRESEETVLAGTPILDVGDPSVLEVVIDVLSREAVRITPGQRVIIDGWGGEGPLTATVARVEPSAFTKVSALGIEEQRVNVIAVLRDPPSFLGDRFEVQAHVVVWSGNTSKVPSTAVFRDGDRWAVFVVRNGRARLQTIETGHRSNEEVAVLTGLNTGDEIVNHPSDLVRDGVRVKNVSAKS